MDPMLNDQEVAVRRLAAIVDSSDDAIVGKDLHSIVTSWNAGAERIFGYSAEEMIGSSIMKLIPDERRSEEDQILSRIKAGERVDHFETIRATKEGKRLNVSITVSPIKDSKGIIIGASKIARDITDRIAAEEALKKAKEAVEAADVERQFLLEREQAARLEVEKVSRIKDEFLATLSHELRTPLNAILGWANVLRTGRFEAGEMAQGLETIERNARVQAQIIDDLLDMSRIISGKVRLDVQHVDLATILDEAVDTVRTAADAKGVRLQVVVDRVRALVAGDPSRLQQVFWNLLNNAIKFTPKEGRIRVLLERVNSHVEVSVIDSGEGISPDFLPFVFNRFEQADASITRRHGGLGLGLAIVKQLVELHGGSVRAKSPGVGEGASFIVQLPLTSVRSSHGTEHSPLPAHQYQSEKLPASAISLEGIRVLVVDDEPDARNLVKRLLEMADAKVSTAGSAAEAMAFLQAEPIEVLVCDIGMPGEDGYSLVRRIRALDHGKGEVAAVALTAYARLQDRTEAIRAGFQYHLSKPVEPAELLAVVQSLGRPRSQCEVR